MTPAPQNRAATLNWLREAPLDVLIIGGGIVGAGIARDAAMRGLRTGLVEQHDFAFGTSSRSSRLLHGGMRYLAQGRLGLVRQGSVEKQIVHRIAPHLAEPLPFIFPTYRDHPDWKLWQLKIGVKIYDLLCGGRNFGNSTWLSDKETLQKVPGLRDDSLAGAVRYYDGFTNDARLVLDTLRSAARSGARLVNYCRFTGAVREETWNCDIEDRLDGQRTRLSAHAVVNATGPWAERVPHSHVKLRATKGIHAVFQRSRLPVPDAVVMTEGKRILFVIPWGERTILGTTDTDYRGDLDDVRANEIEINSLLRIANEFFPDSKLSRPDVVSTWAGLRPLITDAHGNPSDISRAHEIRNPEPGWWDVAGGKLTTYRLMAEETVDEIVKALKALKALKRIKEAKFEECRTALEPLLPQSEVQGMSGIVPPQLSRELVEHYCANEWAAHLQDVMVRRTGWHYYFPEADSLAKQVAEWMGEALGWSATFQAEELQAYAGRLKSEGRRP